MAGSHQGSARDRSRFPGPDVEGVRYEQHWCELDVLDVRAAISHDHRWDVAQDPGHRSGASGLEPMDLTLCGMSLCPTLLPGERRATPAEWHIPGGICDHWQRAGTTRHTA